MQVGKMLYVCKISRSLKTAVHAHDRYNRVVQSMSFNVHVSHVKVKNVYAYMHVHYTYMYINAAELFTASTR